MPFALLVVLFSFVVSGGSLLSDFGGSSRAVIVFAGVLCLSAGTNHSMLAYFDNDALSHLEDQLRDPVAVAAQVRSRDARIVASVHLLEEVLVTGDSERRHRLASALVALIEQEEQVLAPVKQQIEWGWPVFRSGQPAFRPFPASNLDNVVAMLHDARNLPADVLDALREERDREVEKWDAMQSGGRPAFQNALAEGAPVPSASEWANGAFASEFAEDCVMEVVGAAEHERKRVASYMRWNPICRAWLEVLLLEIRRHGILHEVASSKKGPKWPDVCHSAFAPLVTWFVTDDRRFRASLAEHREARPDATWQVSSLPEFLNP